MKYLVCAVVGYLLGCINPAYLISKAKGFDIRSTGSHNAGASNMKITLGWKYGILTAVLDMLKSIAAVMIARYVYPDDLTCQYLAGAMAVMGHILPFYMGFKGGKGYASFLGLLLATQWKLALVLMALCAVITYLSNYIVVATITTVVLAVVYHVVIDAPLPVIIIMASVAAFIIWKHRVNIVRIMNHEEIGLRESGKKKQ